MNFMSVDVGHLKKHDSRSMNNTYGKRDQNKCNIHELMRLINHVLNRY